MIIDITNRKKNEDSELMKAFYLFRLSIDYASEKGEFSKYLERPENLFIERSTNMQLNDDIVKRVDNVSDDYRSLSSYDKQFVQYLMVIGGNVYENNNNDEVERYKYELGSATQDWKDGRLHLEFETNTDEQISILRYQLK